MVSFKYSNTLADKFKIALAKMMQLIIMMLTAIYSYSLMQY